MEIDLRCVLFKCLVCRRGLWDWLGDLGPGRCMRWVLRLCWRGREWEEKEQGSQDVVMQGVGAGEGDNCCRLGAQSFHKCSQVFAQIWGVFWNCLQGHLIEVCDGTYSQEWLVEPRILTSGGAHRTARFNKCCISNLSLVYFLCLALQPAVAGEEDIIKPKFDPGPVEVGWQIYFGAAAGVFPFLIGAWEFGKRIVRVFFTSLNLRAFAMLTNYHAPRVPPCPWALSFQNPGLVAVQPLSPAGCVLHVTPAK